MKTRRKTRLCLERLEDRTTPSYDFGYALGFGTPGVEIGQSVAVDTAGNVAVAGNFGGGPAPDSIWSIDLDPGPGNYSLTSAGSTDGFAASYNPDGTFRWGAHFASTGGNGAFETAFDGSGNLFVSGSLGGTLQIVPFAGAPVTFSTTGIENFLAKFDSNGTLLWARTLGEAGFNRFAYDLATDLAGNVYATGSLYNGNDWAHQGLIAKYDGGSGATIWAQLIKDGTGISSPHGYTTYAHGQGIAVDLSGNVWATGSYLGTIDFNPDPTQANRLTYSGASVNSIDGDVYILKLDAAGNYLWAGSVGSIDFDSAGGIAIDAAGNAYVMGFISAVAGNDFDPGAGKLSLPGGAFVLKTDPAGNLTWARSSVVANQAMYLDPTANVYLTGSFSTTIDADPGPGTLNLTPAGSNDIVISKLDSDGNFVWATSMGGAASDIGRGITVDGAGNIYTTGSFQATADFDPGADTYTLTSTNGPSGTTTSDVFISKLTPSAQTLPAIRINDVTLTEGNAGTSSAVFTVTLSAASDQPVTISYATTNGTAAGGSDYQSVSGTLTFNPGETTETITVPVIGDRLGESNETVLLNLSGATNATITDSQGVATILDDEPRITISDVTMAEGKKGQTTLFTFTVSLSAAYDQAVTMSFRTLNGTATTNNGDYSAKSGTLTFAPGETTKTITIEVKGDSKREAIETFYLDLFGNSSNSLLAKSRGIGTIVNDD